MTTMTKPSEARIPEASYARVARPARRSWWLWAAGIVVVLVGSVWLIRSLGGMSAVASLTEGDITLYRVEPMNLAITLSEDGELKPLKSTELKNEVEGQTTILFLVDESTRVKKGDLLVELASDQLTERIESEELELGGLRSDLDAAKADLELQLSQNDSEIKQAQVDLTLAETDLEKYKNGDLVKEQKAIELDIEETNLRLNQTEDEYHKNQDLQKRGFVTQAKVEQIKLELDTLNLQLDQHQLAMRILQEYDKPMTEQRLTSAVDQARDALDRAKKRADSRTQSATAKVDKYEGLLGLRTDKLNRLKDQVKKCKIVAPTDGVVQYPEDNFGWRSSDQLTVGSQVHEGQTLVVLPDTSKMLVTTRIHEADRHRILEGMKCLIKVPAVPGQTFIGHVSKIAKFADSANRWLNPDLKEHTTEIQLEQTDAPLSPGDTAEIEILVDQLNDKLAVPVQSVFSRGPKNFVFTGVGRSAKPIEVALGSSNTSMVEITSGLSSGDMVHLHPTDKLLAMLPPVQERATEPGAELPQGERPKVTLSSHKEGQRRAPAGRTGGSHGGGSHGGGGSHRGSGG